MSDWHDDHAATCVKAECDICDAIRRGTVAQEAFAAGREAVNTAMREIIAENGPYLGLATTYELLEELRTRMQVELLQSHDDATVVAMAELHEFIGRSKERLPVNILSYRTVDHD